MADAKSEHILFLTGKLAEKQLHRVLESMQPVEFSYEVRNIGVSVAALMTAQMIMRRVSDVNGADRIIVPGLCRGDLLKAGKQLGVPVIRGTEDLKDLPVFFGRDCKPPDLSRYDVMIFAEITDAPMIEIAEMLSRAERYKNDGADVIDIGCLPDTPFPHLVESVQTLQHAGYKVSVDSMEDEELLRGGKAGADYLLSLKEGTLWIAEEVGSMPVLIPDRHGDMDSLFRAIEQFNKKDRPFIADSILDPIHFGFSDSIIRYYQLRQQCPDIDIMMGIGNLTELTEADTTGINAILFGLISELHITSVLATEVSPHARSAVREADKARRMMYAARVENSLPKGLDDSLLTTHARKPFPYTRREIEELAQEIRDPSYRVQISEEGIHVYNRDGMVSGYNPFDVFPKLGLLQEDAPHAFYMGVELARAQIAWQLGKRYNQDEELDWGAATPPIKQKQKDNVTRAAHNLKGKTDNVSIYKEEGSTLKAGKKKRQDKKKSVKILETIITTINPDHTVHIAPMGIREEEGCVVIAPFKPSTTLENLKRSGCAVINMTDDVRIFAGCLTGRQDWPTVLAEVIEGRRLKTALSHIEVEVKYCKEDEQRPRFYCEVRHRETHLPFMGFNRAKAAVLEAAVLVSRLHMLSADKLDKEIDYLRIAIDKTAGDQEREAWKWLMEHIQEFREQDTAGEGVA